MQFRFLLVVAVVALIAHQVVAGSVVDRLKARVNSAPKAAPKKIDPKDPNFDLDEALPVHADYHAGGWTVTNLDDKLVDRAARKIIREIKPAKKEDDKPKKGENKYALTPEEHAALKKLLADADTLVKRASKVAGADASDVAASAVKNAKAIQKKPAGKDGSKKPAAGKAGKKPAAGAAGASGAGAAGSSTGSKGPTPKSPSAGKAGKKAPSAGKTAAPAAPAAAKTAAGSSTGAAAPAAAKTA